MQQHWTTDELIDHWTLLPAERELLANKTGATRLGFAIMLKAFALEGRFPGSLHDIPAQVVAYVVSPSKSVSPQSSTSSMTGAAGPVRIIGPRSATSTTSAKRQRRI